jgi:DeoR/GlpR family transcriptional regulator of sugar metabolism
LYNPNKFKHAISSPAPAYLNAIFKPIRKSRPNALNCPAPIDPCLDLLAERGSVAVMDLVARFDVSEMTIRRDLVILERKGLLRRVHGGAVLDRGRSYEPPFLTRSVEFQEQKARIGAAAATLVKNGESLALDVGTTTLEVARQLAGKNNLTIITPCFQIATVLAETPGIRLILTGGILRPGELSLVGHLAERAFQEFFLDKLFLGAAGVDFETGLTEYSLEDTLVKKAMLRSAKEIILVVDSSKFDKVAFTAIAPLSVVNRIVTDSGLEPATRARLEEENIEVLLV